MAEFQEVCKYLKRMCERYGNNCIECPLDNKDFCSLSAGDRTAKTYEEAEEIIMSWAAEYPEPVYPSVAKYLERLGIIIRRDGTLQADFFKANEPMSVDAAKLLGVGLVEGENEKSD